MAEGVSAQAGGSKKFFVWGSIVLFFAYQFMLRISLSVVKDDLLNGLHLSGADFGVLAGAYNFSYAPLQIPAGMILDRFPLRTVVMASALLCAVGCFVLANAQCFYGVYGARFLMGVGSAAAFLSVLKSAKMFFADSLNRMIGLSMAIGITGAVLGSAPTTSLVQALGWRHAFLVFGAAGLCLAALSFLFIPMERVVASKGVSLSAQLKTVFGNTQVYIVGALMFCIYSVLAVFPDNFGFSFLKDVTKLSAEQAGWYASLVYIGFIVGSFAWPIVVKNYTLEDQKTRKLTNKQVTLVGLAGMAVCFVPVMNGFSSALGLPVLLFGMGFFVGPLNFLYPLVTEAFPTELNGTVNGVLNSLCMMSGFVLPPIVGGFFTTTPPSFSEYQAAFTIVPICLAVGAALLLLTKDKKQQDLYNEAFKK